MKGLSKRVITAGFFLVIMLAGIFGGPYAFITLFSVITGLCLYEFLGMTLIDENYLTAFIRRVAGIILGLVPLELVFLLMRYGNFENITIMVFAVFIPLVFLMFVFEMYSKTQKPFANLAFILMGVVYIGIPFAMLSYITLYRGFYDPNIVFGLLALVWMNDTGAYLGGSKFGKHKLFPSISPKKTWEGFFFGVMSTAVTAYAVCILLPGELSLTNWMFLAGIVIIFGTMGDLVESMLKRSVQVKDSGRLLPGHGGVLDRFDAFIFILPFTTAYLFLIQ